MKSLKGKILSSFMVIIGLALLMGAAIFTSITVMNGKTERMMNEELPLLQTAQDLNMNIAERTSFARGYLLYGQKGYLNFFNEYTEESRKLEKQLLSLVPSAETKEAVVALQEWETMMVDQVIRVYQEGNRDLARSNFRTVVEPAGQYVSDTFRGLSEKYAANIRTGSGEVIKGGTTTALISAGIAGATVLLGLVVAFFMANSLSRPIVRAADRMKSIAAGDLTHEDMKTRSKDEVGDLINSVNAMNRQLRKMAAEIGDMSKTVTGRSMELSQAALEVNSGSQQVSATMEQLSIAAESQANSTSELAESMGIFVGSIMDAHRRGERANGISGEVLSLTEKGNEAMKESIVRMQSIDENVRAAVGKVGKLDGHSKKISSLVNVISEIAEQTNLLALNAAIEAARAGEHGKGFAVVAGEVKKLAEQVANSVSDITEIVTTIQKETGEVVHSLQDSFKQVEAGTEQIESTGTAFERITGSVKQVVETIGLISEDLTAIVDRSESMNASISNIASVSEESSAGIEETAASAEQSTSSMQEIAANAESLSSVAADLDILIRRFKV